MCNTQLPLTSRIHTRRERLRSVPAEGRFERAAIRTELRKHHSRLYFPTTRGARQLKIPPPSAPAPLPQPHLGRREPGPGPMPAAPGTPLRPGAAPQPLTCFKGHLLVLPAAEELQHGDEEDPARVLDAEDGAVAPHGGQHHHPAPAALGGLGRVAPGRHPRYGRALVSRAPLSAVLPSRFHRRAGGGRGTPVVPRRRPLARRRHPQPRRSVLPAAPRPPQPLPAGAARIPAALLCSRARTPSSSALPFPPRGRRFILKGGLPRGRQRREEASPAPIG